MQTRKVNIQFYILILVTALPVLLGWLLYYFHDHFQFNTTNKGTFINPPVEVSFLNPSHEKKWQIIYVTDANCNAACEKLNHQLLQVQKALGKNYDRVRVISFNINDVKAQELQTLIQRAPALRASNNFIVSKKVFLVDPIGNLFMYYQDSFDPMDVLKDLKKVLEVSQIG
jgi:thiol-disulfide isomerase/thioredoxin